MAQQPAVVIIARHGTRLDAVDQEWHQSTPTPYDPPLTYGGWNQSRALGVRIGSLLYAREQSINGPPTATHEPPTPSGVRSKDFARTAHRELPDEHRRKRRRKHKVVIHTSPFLRCVQTSVAIAAGIAQFVPAQPVSNSHTAKSGPGRGRAPNQLHSVSPRISGSDYGATTGLLPVPEPRSFGQEIARRVAEEQKKHRRSKLRVDAFLGEWMNPDYFEHITPPPPSTMMLTTAKAELMHNEAIDVFATTITTKSSMSSLWGGTSVDTRPQSRDSILDDWDDVNDVLPPTSPRRDRTSSHGSIASSDSNTGKRMNYRAHGPQSTFPIDTVAYAPPVPTYAISTSSTIPKGYMAHAREKCTNVDYQWDSSREPLEWGDGGELGEEWSLMHRRFRKGMNNLMYWYSRHNADDRGEDALGLDQADKHEEEEAEEEQEEEDLVVILVTHGAGCNALIGALTGQPVLMDVGMASLTMAVRKDDAPAATMPSMDSSQTFEDSYGRRRGSIDVGLTAMYEMKIVASSEHLRPGYDPVKLMVAAGQRTAAPARLRPFRGDSLGLAPAGQWSPAFDEHATRNSMSTALGSIRRPTSSYFPNVTSAPTSKSNSLTPSEVRDAFSTPDSGLTTPSSWDGGLWTPPAARTPQLAAHYLKDERREVLASFNETSLRSSLGDERFAKSAEHLPQPSLLPAPDVLITSDDLGIAMPSTDDSTRESDQVAQLETLLDDEPPKALRRGLSQEVLWKSRPTGAAPKREFRESPKRRWTSTQEQQSQ